MAAVLVAFVQLFAFVAAAAGTFYIHLQITEESTILLSQTKEIKKRLLSFFGQFDIVYAKMDASDKRGIMTRANFNPDNHGLIYNVFMNHHVNVLEGTLKINQRLNTSRLYHLIFIISESYKKNPLTE